METISIIIPVYNSATTIRQCVYSILNQTFKDFVVYLVDDCSVDNSWEILQQLSVIDERIKIYRLPNNQGPSVARNLALDEANGKWISFIDSDDYISTDFYEQLLIEDTADIIISSFVQVDTQGCKLRKYIATSYFEAKNSSEALDIAYGRDADLDFVYNLCCNKLYRKELFNNIRFPEGRLQEDAFVMPYLIYNIQNGIRCAKNAIYYYVNKNDSISNQAQNGIKDLNRRKDLLFLYDEHIKLYKSMNNKLYMRSRANYLNNVIAIFRLHFFCIRKKKHNNDFKCIHKGFKKHFVRAIMERNPYISWKLVLTLIVFFISPKYYLKIF